MHFEAFGIRTDGRTDGRTHERTDGTGRDGRTHGRTDARTDGRMDGRTLSLLELLVAAKKTTNKNKILRRTSESENSEEILKD